MLLNVINFRNSYSAMMIMDDNKSEYLKVEIGFGLIILAILFFALSVMFLLDRAFLVMANVSA